MSIKVQSHVWEHSSAKGGELLLLLAISDFADDNGVAWPGVDTLAKKARLSTRQAQYNLRSLVSSGQIEIEENAGPHGTHRYRILGVQSLHPAKTAPGVQFPVEGGAISNTRGAISDNQGVQPIAPEPPIDPPMDPSIDPPIRWNASARFQEFWVLYPRKVAKPTAEKAFRKLITPENFGDLIAGVAAWKESDQWLRDGGQYVPYPQKFLNNRYWEDVPEKKAPELKLVEGVAGTSRSYTREELRERFSAGGR